MTTTWSKISGREDSDGGTVVFANPNAPVTTVTFGADGIYVLRLTVSDGAVTVSDDVTITVNPAPVIGSGTGLLGEYFNDPNNGAHFVTFVRGRLDPTVNFDWASTAPATGVSVDNFSVRWTGLVQAPVTGSYTFTTMADDGVRLWVNGALLVDNWIDQAVDDPHERASGARRGGALRHQNGVLRARWTRDRRGCCGHILVRPKSRFRGRNSFRRRTGHRPSTPAPIARLRCRPRPRSQPPRLTMGCHPRRHSCRRRGRV